MATNGLICLNVAEVNLSKSFSLMNDPKSAIAGHVKVYKLNVVPSLNAN